LEGPNAAPFPDQPLGVGRMPNVASRSLSAEAVDWGWVNAGLSGSTPWGPEHPSSGQATQGPLDQRPSGPTPCLGEENKAPCERYSSAEP
jgi:hypothetical protein